MEATARLNYLYSQAVSVNEQIAAIAMEIEGRDCPDYCSGSGLCYICHERDEMDECYAALEGIEREYKLLIGGAE